MVIMSTAVDAADPLAANGARAPPPPPAASNDPAGASLFDVVYGTTAAEVGADTTPWWSSAVADTSSSLPTLQSHGDDLGHYAGSMMDTFLAPLPAPVHMQMQPPPSMAEAQPSYYYYNYDYPQPPGFRPPCFAPAAPFALDEPAGIPIRLDVPLPTTQPASMPPSLYYPQTTTGSAPVEASPVLAETPQAEEDGTRTTPGRRGRPSKSKRALTVSEPEPPAVSKRVAVGSNRAAESTTTSQMTSSAAIGSATTSSSSAGQVPVGTPDQAGASSSSTGSTSGQVTAACTGTNNTPMPALLCEERCQLQRPAFSNGAPAAGVVLEGHQQAAAIAPPEAMVTGPQYADTSAVGVRFHPTDQELIYYLGMKYAQQQMPVEFFKEFDVYQADPTAIKGACGEGVDGSWYAFSPRDRKYRNGQRPARSVFAAGGSGEQVGFWKSNSKLGEVRDGGRKDGAVVGRMTSLTFQLGRQPRGRKTGWKMKEYTIPENQQQPDGSAMLLNEWVVCKLFHKERSGCTNTESKTDENAAIFLGQERPTHGKSEKDKDATSVGQKRRPRRRKSEKDKNAIAAAVGQEDGGPGEAAAGESVQGEGDTQQMVPAAHQASDNSEQDLCVEDYLLCDVAFAQQNEDAANCTI